MTILNRHAYAVLLHTRRSVARIGPTVLAFAMLQASHTGAQRISVLLGLAWLVLLVVPAGAAEMTNDPGSFLGIRWGDALAGRSDVQQTYSSKDVADYQCKNGPPLLGTIPVESVTFTAWQDRFARVTIRYRGNDAHQQVMAYLEEQYGALDKTPGQMVRGLNQQFNWRGPETEINVTFQAQSGRGFIFIESRVLSPRFNDALTDSGE